MRLLANETLKEHKSGPDERQKNLSNIAIQVIESDRSEAEKERLLTLIAKESRAQLEGKTIFPRH